MNIFVFDEIKNCRTITGLVIWFFFLNSSKFIAHCGSFFGLEINQMHRCRGFAIIYPQKYAWLTSQWDLSGMLKMGWTFAEMKHGLNGIQCKYHNSNYQLKSAANTSDWHECLDKPHSIPNKSHSWVRESNNKKTIAVGSKQKKKLATKTMTNQFLSLGPTHIVMKWNKTSWQLKGNWIYSLTITVLLTELRKSWEAGTIHKNHKCDE